MLPLIPDYRSLVPDPDMRLRIAHRTVHRYDPPAAGVIQVLRLTPRNHDGQYVIRWRIDVSTDARLAAHEDAFGNLIHVFSADGPFEELSVEVEGEVETQNTNGVVHGTVERFPPSLFLRDTGLTQADATIRGMAQDIRAANGGNVLAELHALLDGLHEGTLQTARTRQDGGAASAGKTAAAYDLVHTFIGAARSLGIPARFVSGYLCTDADGEAEQETGYAWAESYVPGLGWVGFDPAQGACPTDAHVRVAVGLDSVGAAPERGTRYGMGDETLEVAIKVGQ
jgi:transglutaminase-like putative cysteine protease